MRFRFPFFLVLLLGACVSTPQEPVESGAVAKPIAVACAGEHCDPDGRTPSRFPNVLESIGRSAAGIFK